MEPFIQLRAILREASPSKLTLKPQIQTPFRTCSFLFLWLV